jgi:hypothetical protein
MTSWVLDCPLELKFIRRLSQWWDNASASPTCDKRSLHAIEPAKVRGRPGRRQASRSAHHCRGRPSPHRSHRTSTHFVSASAFRAGPARGLCRRSRLSGALRSYRAPDLSSTVSSLLLTPPNRHRCQAVTGGGDSQLRQQLLQPLPPFPPSHPSESTSCNAPRSR